MPTAVRRRPLWCKHHLGQLRRAALRIRNPVNPELWRRLMFAEWLAVKGAELGERMPVGRAELNELLNREAPLCCRLGEPALATVHDRSIVPILYRMLPHQLAWRLHLEAFEQDREAETEAEADGCIQADP